MVNGFSFEENVYLCNMDEKKLLYTFYNYGPELIAWVKAADLPELSKNALRNEEEAMLIMAISYQYGVLTEVSLNLAEYYYNSLIERYKNFYAYMNLGVMLVEANYLHTAMQLFEDADNQFKDNTDQLGIDDAKLLLKNIDSCRLMLNLVYEERRKRLFLQHHSPLQDKPWEPSDPLRVAPADFEE